VVVRRLIAEFRPISGRQSGPVPNCSVRSVRGHSPAGICNVYDAADVVSVALQRLRPLGVDAFVPREITEVSTRSRSGRTGVPDGPQGQTDSGRR
jgi:hypothetical protein